MWDKYELVDNPSIVRALFKWYEQNIDNHMRNTPQPVTFQKKMEFWYILTELGGRMGINPAEFQCPASPRGLPHPEPPDIQRVKITDSDSDSDSEDSDSSDGRTEKLVLEHVYDLALPYA